MPRRRTRSAILPSLGPILLAAAALACTPAAPSPAVTANLESSPLPSASPIESVAATLLPSPIASLQPTAFDRNPAPISSTLPYRINVDPADFVAVVDNPFFPLTPGTKWVYDGDEHVEVRVLAETKEILGVPATVVHDQVFTDGGLAEDTFDWFAQDRDGNVWYFGEDTKELANGKVTSTAGSWEAGVKGAQPGIVMLALPHVGDEYRQEFLAGEAEDLGAVTALEGSVKVPAGTWSGSIVLVTEEWTPLEPDIRERKTYVWGVGLVKSEAIKGPHEVTTLTRMTAS
jgi:hypothetical protein